MNKTVSAHLNQDDASVLNMISTAKVISMILVVLYHSLLTLNGTWGGAGWCFPEGQSIASWLNTFHVATFSFCSGALFAYKKYDASLSIKAGIKKRFKQLMIPYLVVSVIWAIPFRIIIFHDSFVSIVKSFVFMIQPAQLWFLPMLFLIYICFRTFYPAVATIRKFPLLMLFLTIYIVAVLLWEKIPLGVFQVGTTMKNMVFYWLGIAFFESERLKKIIADRKEVLVICFLASIGLYILSGKQINLALKNAVVLLSGLSGIFAVLSVSAQLTKVRSLNPAVKLLGTQSMGIYLFHQQLLYITMRAFASVINLRFIYVTLNFAFALAGAYLLSVLIRKCKIGSVILGR